MSHPNAKTECLPVRSTPCSLLGSFLQCIGTKSPYSAPLDVPSVKLSHGVFGCLTQFCVCVCVKANGDKKQPWVAVMLEYVFTFGFQAICLNIATTQGVLTRRFRDCFRHVLKHHGIVWPAVTGSRHLMSFGRGFKPLSGFAASREFCHKDRTMVACLTDRCRAIFAAISCEGGEACRGSC